MGSVIKYSNTAGGGKRVEVDSDPDISLAQVQSAQIISRRLVKI